MSIPTLEEKLTALKVTPASDYERSCAEALPRGAYEIAVQRTADILRSFMPAGSGPAGPSHGTDQVVALGGDGNEP